MASLHVPTRSVTTLAYEHLNLRFNPFGELDEDLRARVSVVEPIEVELGEVVQVLGAAGRGKSTHLLTWHHATPSSAYEYIPEGSDRVRTDPIPAFFFLDEAQRLRPRDRSRLFARVPRLVLASHVDLSRYAHRPVRTIVLQGLDERRLARILSRRIEAARRGTGPLPTISCEALSGLLRRFGDDLRAMESYLYDVFQMLEGPCDVQV